MGQESMARGFFLLAHDEFTGRARCDQGRLRCGVVGAQLADLMIAGRLGMGGGRVLMLDADPVPDGDGRAPAYVVECLKAAPRALTVRTWATNLGEQVTEMIAIGLVDDGVVRRETGRGFGRRPDRFRGLDLLRAGAPRSQVAHAFTSPKDLDLTTAFLITLIWSLQVERIVDLPLDRASADDLVARIRAHMPSVLRELLEGIDDAATASSLTIRN